MMWPGPNCFHLKSLATAMRLPPKVCPLRRNPPWQLRTRPVSYWQLDTSLLLDPCLSDRERCVKGLTASRRRCPLTSPPSQDYRLEGWVCEHRWEGIAGLVAFRKAWNRDVDQLAQNWPDRSLERYDLVGGVDGNAAASNRRGSLCSSSKWLRLRRHLYTDPEQPMHMSGTSYCRDMACRQPLDLWGLGPWPRCPESLRVPGVSWATHHADMVGVDRSICRPQGISGS